MSLSRKVLRPASDQPRRPGTAVLALVAALGAAQIGCVKGDVPTIPETPLISVITIDSGTRIFERGTKVTMTATARNYQGVTVATQLSWRSSNEKVAMFQAGGALVAVDTGVATITASALGVTSTPAAVRVVWVGPSRLLRSNWTAPNTITPGAAVTDSLRVLVINPASAAVPNAKVVFAVTQGGGSVSPATVTTGANGIASTKWTVGPTAGKNSITASVVDDEGKPLTAVTDNGAVFTVTSYQAFAVVSGADQSGLLLSTLPVAPGVKLLDTLGKPRAGVPVTFTAFGGGRITTPVVSTGSDGVASPGPWTLGDVPGQQSVEARVDDARQTITATATGTPIRYSTGILAAGGLATCGIDGFLATCWGATPLNGTGDGVDVSTPTVTRGGVAFTALNGGQSHFCGVTPANEGYCWGVDALVDTSGKTTITNAPTLMPTDLRWKDISPGGTTTAGSGFTCGITIANDPYCWGTNTSGQLGDGKVVKRIIPDVVAGGFKFSQIASGGGHACGLSLSGSAFCWGANLAGQLGDGTFQQRLTPTAVGGALTFQSIGAGESLTCGLTTAGKPYCWGGAAGVAQSSPVTYPTAPVFTSITVGAFHVCGLTSDGTAYCWGDNSAGQIGDSTGGQGVVRTAPTLVAGGLKFSQLSAGYAHTCGRTKLGDVACWGFNAKGELGESPTTSSVRLVPHFIILGVRE